MLVTDKQPWISFRFLDFGLGTPSLEAVRHSAGAGVAAAHVLELQDFPHGIPEMINNL